MILLIDLSRGLSQALSATQLLLAAWFLELWSVGLWLSAFLFALLLTPFLARIARATGFVDVSQGSLATRKLQRKGVPYVGGTVLLGVLVMGAVLGDPAQLLDPGGLLHLGQATHVERGSVWASLVLAYLVGLLDDGLPEGLKPGAKLSAQFLLALPLAFFSSQRFGPELASWMDCSVFQGGLWAAGLSLVLAVVAMNVANTFDNHDGALTGVGAVGLLFSGSPIAAGLLGFLPWNLDAEARFRSGPGIQRDEGASPTAYLGDSGSHLLGLVVLLNVWAWPLLFVPFLDLLRLCVVRCQAGRAPWVGDQSHLAHRLARQGWSRRRVAISLGLLTIPACLGAWLGRFSGRVWGPQSLWILAGCSLSAILVLALLWGGRPHQGD